MKAPAFDYVRAKTLAEALALLRRHGEDAKIIAGGQSLVPALNLRLITPRLVVDIGGLDELKGVSAGGGRVRIGALTRHVELIRSTEIETHLPLVARAVRYVAHPAIRNRGTVGGSLAQADPASELPACAVALGAEMIVAAPEGERRIAAIDFFTGIYETALKPDEILVAVEMPAIRPGERSAFVELARRTGDYALAGLAAQAAVDDGILRELRLAFFGMGPKPALAENAARYLIGGPVTEGTIGAAEAALSEELKPHDDLSASAATRHYLARVLMRRALGELLPEVLGALRRSA